MEVLQVCDRVSPPTLPATTPRGVTTALPLTSRTRSRSHLPDGLKTKKWEDRMEKTKKAQAIKKLQTELKDEKLAEIQRCVNSRMPLAPHAPSG